MDTPNITPEQITPEITATEATGTGIESTPIAETVTGAATIPVVDDANASATATAPITLEDPDPGKTVTEEEVVDLTSSSTQKADGDWIGKVKEVIKEDEGQPFKEEADAEILNEDYMKKRFNIDVDAPIEEK